MEVFYRLIVTAVATFAVWSLDAFASGQELFILANEGVVDPAAVDAAADDGEDAEEEGEEEEDPRVAAIGAQFEPAVRAQLSFANRACQWTEEERKSAIAAAREWLRQYSVKVAKQNGQIQNGGLVLFAAGMAPRAQAANLGDEFEDQLVDMLRKAMSDEQRTRYDAELERRKTFLAEAVIENLVAQADQRLDLQPKQREQILQSLRNQWNAAWIPPLQMFVQMPQYIVAFPDEHIVPHLSPLQNQIWRGVQKISARGMMFGGGMFGGNEQMIDDVDLNEGR